MIFRNLYSPSTFWNNRFRRVWHVPRLRWILWIAVQNHWNAEIYRGTDDSVVFVEWAAVQAVKALKYLRASQSTIKDKKRQMATKYEEEEKKKRNIKTGKEHALYFISCNWVKALRRIITNNLRRSIRNSVCVWFWCNFCLYINFSFNHLSISSFSKRIVVTLNALRGVV